MGQLLTMDISNLSRQAHCSGRLRLLLDLVAASSCGDIAERVRGRVGCLGPAAAGGDGVYLVHRQAPCLALSA